jgi:2'-5' RNA ligase
VRLFIAADLHPEVRGRLRAIQEELRPVPLPVRWVRPEGIHLTFKFLGEVPPAGRGAIETALKSAADGGPRPFALEAAGVGTFPETGPPRVIWIGVRGSVEEAAKARRGIDAALEEIGYPPEQRDFRPHLTLGRVKGPGRGDWKGFLAGFAEAPAGGFEVRTIVLFESRLDSGGATYLPLAAFPLAGGAPA